MNNKIKILIVDDHPIVRQGIIYLLEKEKDIQVCGEAEDALEALAAIPRLKPNLIIIDISLPIGNGLELIKNISTLYPQIIMLVLSMHDESLYAERVVRAGAKGYIMKSEATDKLITAIRRVADGEIFLSKDIKERIFTKVLQSSTKPYSSSIDLLSDRELQIFQMVGEGIKTRTIANNLNLSISTVNTHYTHIKKKLGLTSNNELIQYAVNWFLSEGKK